MQVFRLFVVALLVCVLALPMMGCGKSPKPPAKADPADKIDDMKAMRDVLPPPGASGQIPSGQQPKTP
jgi:hypothetical protein